MPPTQYNCPNIICSWTHHCHAPYALQEEYLCEGITSTSLAILRSLKILSFPLVVLPHFLWLAVLCLTLLQKSSIPSNQSQFKPRLLQFFLIPYSFLGHPGRTWMIWLYPENGTPSRLFPEISEIYPFSSDQGNWKPSQNRPNKVSESNYTTIIMSEACIWSVLRLLENYSFWMVFLL